MNHKKRNIFIFFISIMQKQRKILRALTLHPKRDALPQFPFVSKFQVRQVLIFFTITLLLANCAQTGNLSGGEKDTTAPQIDSTQTTGNYQTNFEQQDIEITFQDWVQLNDIQKQLIVSPPLEFKPKISLNKKTVRFEFDKKEVLKDSTTYVINFGNAIGDITENNKVAELRYVLSTGNFIDSLEASGKVLDIDKNAAAEGATIMLYTNLADSVIRTEKPYYFAKTDKSGNFKIQNLKADTFKVVTLLEENNNYLYDGGEEKIGFLEEPVIITDSSINKFDLILFQEEKKLRVTEREVKNYGKVKLVFNTEPENLSVSYDSIQQVHQETDQDSLLFWYDVDVDTLDWQIYLAQDTSFLDTTKVKIKRDTLFKKRAKLRAVKSKEEKNRLMQNEAFLLAFNHPINRINTAKISILEDTLKNKIKTVVAVDSSSLRKLRFRPAWQESQVYEIILLPDAVEDIYGLKNRDTISRNVQVLGAKELATLNLTFRGLKPEYNYLMDLMTNDNVVEQFNFSGDTAFQKNFILLPGKYSIKTIQDSNKNGRWDTGSYDNKTFPEKFFTSTIDEELLANWERAQVITLETEEGKREKRGRQKREQESKPEGKSEDKQGEEPKGKQGSKQKN